MMNQDMNPLGRGDHGEKRILAAIGRSRRSRHNRRSFHNLMSRVRLPPKSKKHLTSRRSRENRLDNSLARTSQGMNSPVWSAPFSEVKASWLR